MKAVLGFAHRHGLPVVEDAACAAGSEIRTGGRFVRIGRPHADIACFSFHPRKLITTGDGGMLTTRSAQWDRKFRLWRHHSMNASDLERHGRKRAFIESYLELGYNFRMTDIQAAVGREQLKKLPGMVRRRRVQARRYARILSGIPGVVPPSEPAWARSNFQTYCVRLPRGTDKRRVMDRMAASGAAVRTGIMCAHKEPAYTRGGGRGSWRAAGSLKESERALAGCVLLPFFSTMKTSEMQRVARSLARALKT